MVKRAVSVLLTLLILVVFAFGVSSTVYADSAGTTLKITRQPESATVLCGDTVTVTFDVEGEGLTYKWYYKNVGSTKFSVTNTFKSNIYFVDMTDARHGRQIYCVVTDANGNSVTTDTFSIYHNHLYDDGEVKKAPACTEDGQVVYTCERCENTLIEKEKCTGHNLGGWTVVSNATIATYGLECRSCSACDYTEERYTEKLDSEYSITMNLGLDESERIGVDKDGKYTLPVPEKTGYTFIGWKDAQGNDFPASGVYKGNITVTAVWDVADTSSFEQLIALTEAGAEKIKVTGNIVVNQPVFIAHDITIYSDEDYSITRATDYPGDIFVVGQDKHGETAIINGRTAVLNLGGGKGNLTIDGNKDNMAKDVVGSAVYVSDSSVVNIYDGVKIANHNKTGNERAFEGVAFASAEAIDRVGGAAIAIINGTVNMYGGVIENNSVVTEKIYVTTESGSYISENNACGGAIYNRANFNMYGGKITGNSALRGGAIYNDEIIVIYAGEISGNTASTYGGAISSSASSDSQNFFGLADSEKELVISNNKSGSAGGAIYSNTSSPIVIYGNTKFIGNATDSIGGAIYTGGALTVYNTEFTDNTSASFGGAINHKYSNPSFDRRFCEITNCIFNGNKANYGGALSLGASANEDNIGTYAIISNSTFADNQALAGNGGAVYASDYTEAVIENSSFEGNSSSGSAGAVSIHGSSVVAFNKVDFEYNSAVNGGAINIALGETSFADCSFVGNTASYGGGIFANPADFNVDDTSFKENKATVSGGAVCLNGATMSVTGTSSFEGNLADDRGAAVYVTSYGETKGALVVEGGSFESNTGFNSGAVDLRSGCSASFTSTEFINNRSSNENTGYAKYVGGGAVYVNTDATLTLTGVTMDGNTSANYGGAVMVYEGNVSVTENSVIKNSSAQTGSAIYLINYKSVEIKDITLENNSAVWNGTVYASGTGLTLSNVTAKDNTADKGGVFYFGNGTNDLTNITATSNNAKYGGVIYSGSGKITLTDNNFDQNTASYGGVLYVADGEVTVTDCTFSENSASNGGAVNVAGGSFETDGATYSANSATSSGGAIYANPSTLTVTDSIFESNTAGYGGAVSLNGAEMTVNGNTEFSSNSATTRGGAIDVTKSGEVFSTLTITNGSFTSNTAPTGGAVYLRTGCSATFDGTSFKLNSSTDTNTSNSKEIGGGAIFVYTDANLTLTDVTMDGNTSANYGGAVMVNGGNIEVNGDSIIKNSSASTGAAIYLLNYKSAEVKDLTLENNSAVWNGTVYASGTGAEFENITATGNSSDKGGVFYLSSGKNTLANITAENNSAKTAGGVIYIGGGETAITSSTLTSNSSKSGGTLYIAGGTVEINGSEISNNSASSNGGAIYMVAGNIAVNDSEVKENSAPNGGAVYVEKGTFSTEGSQFIENTATYSGGAIYANPATLTVTDSVFESNTAGYGGAVSLNGAEMTVDGNTEFNSNSATTRGGAVYVIGGTVTIADSQFSLNTAANGGAINIQNGEATVTDCTFSENSASNGGAVNVAGGSFETEGTTYSANSATSSGGAIYATPSTLTVTDSIFESNTAGYGGAVSLNGAEMTVDGNTEFSSNSATTRGGAIDCTLSNNDYGKINMTNGSFTSNSAPTGGAVYLRTGCSATFDGTSFKLNSSTDTNTSNSKEIGGGAVYAHTNASLTLAGVTMDGNTSAKYGGAVMINGGTLTINGNSVIKNSYAATHGAAMYLYSATVTVTDTELTGNEAQWQGTVYIGNSGTYDFENVTAENNKANQGGVFCLCDSVTAKLKNVTAKNNSAKDMGGVIYHYAWGGTLTIDSCTFTSNTATNKGGVMWAGAKAPVEIIDSTFKSNTSAAGGALYLDTTMFSSTNASPANVTIKGNTLFEENFATSNGGGAIYIADTSSAGTGATTLVVNGATFKNNKSFGAGGAISTDDKSYNLVIKVTDSIFESNQAGYNNSSGNPGGGAVEIQNGNGYSNGDPAEIKIVFTDCVFTNNSCKGTGGAIDIRSESYVKIDGISATGNKSTLNWNGGVVYVTSAGSRLYLTGEVTSSGNSAAKGTFAYVNNAAAYLYTTHDSSASWVAQTQSLSDIKYNQTTMP